MKPVRTPLRLPRLTVRVAAACFLLLAALLLVACGGDEDTSTSASTTATSATEAGGLSVSVEPAQALAGTTVAAAVVNDTDKEFTYGADYELEREVDGDFEPVKLPKRPVIQIGYVAKAGEIGPPVSAEIPADATPGTYRVVIQRDVTDVGDVSGEFEVIDDS